MTCETCGLEMFVLKSKNVLETDGNGKQRLFAVHELFCNNPQCASYAANDETKVKIVKNELSLG